MKRRDFLAASCLAGMATVSGAARGADKGNPSNKQLYELRLYKLPSAEKAEALDAFLAKTMIPALNRLGVRPVGVFAMIEGDSHDRYVLLPHCCAESLLRTTAGLMADEKFLEAGAAFLDAEKDDPAYERVESALLLAFDGMPKLETPAKGDSRVFQLRTYESHSMMKGKRKIEMFNSGGEIAIFHRTGLTPVFFGEALIGSKLPNLTYMLGFDDMETLKKGWAAFSADPEWQKLRKDPRYKDTVSGITNILLRPTGGSQI